MTKKQRRMLKNNRVVFILAGPVRIQIPEHAVAVDDIGGRAGIGICGIGEFLHFGAVIVETDEHGGKEEQCQSESYHSGE